jgi:hypothetical protein
MDIIFNCPHCDQELAVDSSGAGSKIDCPACGEEITIPAPKNGPVPAAAGHARAGEAINPIAVSAAAKIEKHLRVPVHSKTESLIEKPKPPLDAAAKGDKTIKVKTIRRTECVEVGHDKFDEVVTNFLNKIGESNIINISPVTYTHVDIGSQKILADYGVLVVYRG